MTALLADPENLAHRFVEAADRFRLVHLSRADHAAMPFLTDEYLGERAPIGEVSAAEALALPADASLHFLFHSAFCSSTLLVRALSRPGVAMGLSEPVVLNDVVGFRRRGADPRAVARAADAATRLLARPFGPGEAVVVKPSTVLNPLAALITALRPQSRVLFLHAPLETFLVSVARKGLWCRLWVREQLEGLLRDQAVNLGMTMEDHFRQSDLQVAAVGWLAHHQLFHALAARIGAERFASLDADRFSAAPAAGLAAVARHYGLALDRAAVDEIVAGPAFTRHSKSGEAYGVEQRAADYAAVRAAHGDEIGKVVEWARAVAEGVGIAFEAPFALLQPPGQL